MKLQKLSRDHVEKFTKRREWLRGEWEKSLASLGVKWPERSPVAMAQLVGLSFFLGQPVSKDSLGEFSFRVAGGARDAQARHLRRMGWNVVGSGRGEPQTNRLADGTRMPPNSYALLSVMQPAATFVRDSRLKREGRIGARDWEELCKVYGDRCAHCGKSTKHLDKGHMDPNKGMELSNLIPLCIECNNWALEDIIFNETGRVEAVRSERFLKKADHAARERIFGWLKQTLQKHQ